MTRFLCGVILLAAAVPIPGTASAQTAQQAQLGLTVIDQTGASIPGAQIRVTPAAGEPVEVTADQRGQVTITALPVGVVALHVEFGGFNSFDGNLTLRRGANNQTVTLTVAGLQEEIVVSETEAGDTRGHAQTTTLEEEDVAALSDDPDELQAQLEAMTGGAGAVFQVNGFEGGRLPNRDEIRQIRFRTNSFSADNHDAGRTRVEIVTRPGLARWSGNVNFGLRNDVLNARNAFARTQTPEQFRRFSAGLRGPLVRSRTSVRLNLDGNRSFDSGTIVALTPEGAVADVVRRPFDRTNVTLGLEHALTGSQTMRLEYRGSDDARRNLGVGDFNLAERAFSRASNEHQLRASLQSVIGRSMLNELRVEFNDRDTVSASDSTAPAVVVVEAFSRGGAGVSSVGTSRTLELADNFDFTVRRHALRAGVLLEAESFTTTDARNAAGTFTFSSLDSFLAGAPATFTQRVGELRTSVSQYQLGLYVQDDVRIARAFSLSLGLRQEMQNHLDDPVNLMPRIGFTVNPTRATTIRGGYGIFHDWLGSDLYDQTQRVTGTAAGQRDILILNPGYPDPTGSIAPQVFGGGRVQADPGLKLPYVHQVSIGVERSLAPSLNLQASLMTLRGRNQFRSRNLNAPDEFGVRPEPTVGTVTQIESTGRSATTRLTLGLNYRVPSRRLFFTTNYTLSSVKNHADNATALPANSLDPDAEWGPSSQDVRHRFNAMFNFGLPFGVRANIGANASSAAPYTILTGRDDNRDGVVNDRPASVGRNSERGAARWEMNMRLSRAFGLGGSRGGPRAAQRGGPGPGGGGPGPFGGGGDANQRFSFEVYAQAFNLMNRTNFVNFSGSMLSPFFGTPTSAAQARRVEVGLRFGF